ncbi:hypothetical protein ATO3_14670 [Marinibacterium profundimaris]|uniref:Mycothiol-dependent maleylpyruvate isomerase metal-binding domain-containing protein n=1 Tax=Marinibacterium profundimaris TaxID=1679460 RepID=A0A225NHH7_9RHOB|nr:hypothetical protein ATO3_14670 [Marinibacterium profundimaris]
MGEAADFLAECEALHALLDGREAGVFTRVTQFKGWTVEEVLIHLQFWNRAADLSALDGEAFGVLMEEVGPEIARGRFRAVENARIEDRGPALLAAWITHAREMAHRWAGMDPKARLPWAGPSMSARSSITARQMETWAHGFEIFDLLGVTREDTDRIRNIVVLGVNTFGWSHRVHGLEVPAQMPRLQLTAPSGELWTYGAPEAGRIAGTAVDFASVVTQTRALADTGLEVEGPVARTWMAHAQCFAGAPEMPPAPGTRRRA